MNFYGKSRITHEGKVIGEIIIPGINKDERCIYRNKLKTEKGIFIPCSDLLDYNNIIIDGLIFALGTLDKFNIFQINSIYEDEFDYSILDGHIDNLKLFEKYIGDSRFVPRLTTFDEMLKIEKIIKLMSDEEYKKLLDT